VRVELLIVTYAADRWWLNVCLQSVRRHTSGFARVVVVHPRQDEAALRDVCLRYEADTVPIEEASGKGHLNQNRAKCLGDVFCPGADAVCHIDSDSVFIERATPADYFVEERPILWRRSYAGLFAQMTGAWLDAYRLWQQNVERALGWPEEWETMCRLPIVHLAEVYSATRARIEQVHGTTFDAYVLGQPCDITAAGVRRVQPHFTEFDTLGSVALRTMPARYEIKTIPDDVHLKGLPAPWPGSEAWALEPRPRLRQFMSNELRQPGGISQATLAALRSYGLDP